MGLLRRDDADADEDERNNTSAQRWARRLGLEEQRLYEMVRLRAQFLQLLQDSGLCSVGGEKSGAEKAAISHRRALQQAQHREHLKTKRRRMLTLQDNVSWFFYPLLIKYGRF